MERVPCLLGGRSTERLLFIFRAVGCSWARSPGGGCTNCGFLSLSSANTPPSPSDLIAQFESVADAPDAFLGIGEVDLYNSGSFLNDEEIPPLVREHVCRRLAGSGVQRVLIESRPEYVVGERLRQVRHWLGGVELELGIGLESVNDRVRDVLVRKGYSRQEFERAARTVAEQGARLLVYVLLKPLGLEEAAAVRDAIETSRYVFALGTSLGVKVRVALEPTFVAPHTVLENAFLNGEYLPPSLWSALEVIRSVQGQGEILVGLSDEGLEPKRLPAGCEHCTAKLRAALVEYNRTQEFALLNSLDCSCRTPALRGQPEKP